MSQKRVLKLGLSPDALFMRFKRSLDEGRIDSLLITLSTGRILDLSVKVDPGSTYALIFKSEVEAKLASKLLGKQYKRLQHDGSKKMCNFVIYTSKTKSDIYSLLREEYKIEEVTLQ